MFVLFFKGSLDRKLVSCKDKDSGSLILVVKYRKDCPELCRYCTYVADPGLGYGDEIFLCSLFFLFFLLLSNQWLGFPFIFFPAYNRNSQCFLVLSAFLLKIHIYFLNQFQIFIQIAWNVHPKHSPHSVTCFLQFFFFYCFACPANFLQFVQFILPGLYSLTLLPFLLIVWF